MSDGKLCIIFLEDLRCCNSWRIFLVSSVHSHFETCSHFHGSLFSPYVASLSMFVHIWNKPELVKTSLNLSEHGQTCLDRRRSVCPPEDRLERPLQVVLQGAEELVAVERDDGGHAEEEEHGGLDGDGHPHHAAQEAVATGEDSSVHRIGFVGSAGIVLQRSAEWAFFFWLEVIRWGGWTELLGVYPIWHTFMPMP